MKTCILFILLNSILFSQMSPSGANKLKSLAFPGLGQYAMGHNERAKSYPKIIAAGDSDDEDLTDAQREVFTRKDRAADFWDVRGDMIVRVHHKTRRRIFRPEDAVESLPDGVSTDILKKRRTSIVQYTDGRTEVLTDQWRQGESSKRLATKWTGETQFWQMFSPEAVSYTHQTLPTSDLV